MADYHYCSFLIIHDEGDDDFCAEFNFYVASNIVRYEKFDN